MRRSTDDDHAVHPRPMRMVTSAVNIGSSPEVSAGKQRSFFGKKGRGNFVIRWLQWFFKAPFQIGIPHSHSERGRVVVIWLIQRLLFVLSAVFVVNSAVFVAKIMFTPPLIPPMPPIEDKKKIDMWRAEERALLAEYCTSIEGDLCKRLSLCFYFHL
jgi:hypothetical protein